MGSKGLKAKARLLLRARTFNPWYIMNRKLPNLNSCVHQECPKDFKTGFKSAVALQIKKLCGFKGCVLSGICKNLRNFIFANLQNLNSCVDLAWPKDSKTGFKSAVALQIKKLCGFKGCVLSEVCKNLRNSIFANLQNLNSCVYWAWPKDSKTGFKSAVALQIKKLCGFKGCALPVVCKNLRNFIFANLQNLNSCVDWAWLKDSKTGFGSQIDPILREKIGFKVLENCWRLKGYPRSSRTENSSAPPRRIEYLCCLTRASSTLEKKFLENWILKRMHQRQFWLPFFFRAKPLEFILKYTYMDEGVSVFVLTVEVGFPNKFSF